MPETSPVKLRPTAGAIAAAALALTLGACGDGLTAPDAVDMPILYESGGRLYVAPDTGGTEMLVFEDENFIARLGIWSPRGTHILMWAFDRSDDNSRNYHVIDADGSGRVQVTNIGADVSALPTWSPDGQRIAFIGTGGDIWVVDRDGSNQENIFPGDMSSAEYPHWSPNGQWIVFQGSVSGEGGIYRIRPDGSDLERLNPLGGNVEGSPRYSPDGSKIAYQVGQDLWMMDADGGNEEQLTFTPAEGDWWPRWAPDSRHIAFHTDGGTHWAIGVLDTSTKAIVDQFGLGSRDNLYPVWSGDGTQVAWELEGQVGVQVVGSGEEWIGLGSGNWPSWHPGR